MVDEDIKKEYQSQKSYLENCVKVLRKRQQAAAISNQNENKNIMQENRRLIDMIGRLRAQNMQLNNKFNGLQATKGMKLKEVLEI